MRSASPKLSDVEAGEIRLLAVSLDLAGLRVDRALAETFQDLSRSRIHDLIVDGAVQLNHEQPKPSAKLHLGDQLRLTLPGPVPSALEPERGNLKILFEDESFLVVSKAAGVVVHPGAGAVRGTLAAFLLEHCGSLSLIGGVTRPGIVHRLDKGTSGLMVVAKTDQAHRSLSAQFKARTVTKIYTAICLGTPRPARGSVRLALGRDPRHRQRIAVTPDGRAAHTDYEVTELLGAVSVVRLQLHTGRTHQIRVHLASLKCPLVGDNVYGALALASRSPQTVRAVLSEFPRPALHAQILGFAHPRSGHEVRFEEPWPEDLERLRLRLKDAAAPNPGGLRR